MRILLSIAFLLFGSLSLFSQDVEMASGLRSSGKIYVVVIVLLIVLVGLFAYLIKLERKINQIEKERNE